MQQTDVVVIGAGLSGLLACKYMKAAGLSCLVFEETDDIGGVWKYRETPNGRGGVTFSTVSTSSKSVNEFADFPMPDEYPPFQKHTQVFQYLNDYADHFNLREAIRLNHKIVKVAKRGDGWETQDDQGAIYRSRYLIVCSGMHQFPNKFYEQDKCFCSANVERMHSSEYKRLTDKFFGKDILIFGGGETASDMAVELTHAANSVTMSIPHGQWLFPAVTPVKVHTNGAYKATMVSDTFSSRLRRLVDPPFATYESCLETKAHFTSRTFEKWGGKNGHGIPEWENEAPYYGQFFNKNAHVVQLVHRGMIDPKGDVKSVQGDIVEFADGSKKRVDLIIFCSGYHTRFPFFEDERYGGPVNKNFLFVLCNEDPTLAFIGFARPLVGSFMGLSEMQSIYVSKLFSGEIEPPPKQYREETIAQEKVFQELVFSSTTNRIDGLVNFQSYMDEMAALAGVRPNYWKLLLKNPIKWYYAVSAAHNNCQFLLNDESYHDEIFRRYRRYHPDNLKVSAHVYALIVNMFPRLFDDKDSVFTPLKRIFSTMFDFLLIILFSPILLFRILFPIEQRWKRKKRRMIEDNTAAELLKRVRGGDFSYVEETHAMEQPKPVSKPIGPLERQR
jgi:cation diffusion facilitator CzcD-associated flavoprotein CzcO